MGKALDTKRKLWQIFTAILRDITLIWWFVISQGIKTASVFVIAALILFMYPIFYNYKLLYNMYCNKCFFL